MNTFDATLSSGLATGLGAPALGALGGFALARLGDQLAGRRLARAPLVGAAGGVALVSAVASTPGAFGWSVALGLTLALAATIDAASLRLPDLLTLPLAVLGLVHAALSNEPLIDHVVGALLGYAALAGVAWSFRRLTGRSGLGLGDAKLLGAGGAWLGWDVLPQTLLIACAIGFCWVAARIGTRGMASLKHPFAFGPPLCAAIFLAWLLR